MQHFFSAVTKLLGRLGGKRKAALFLFVTFFKLLIQVLHHTLHSDVCPTQETIKMFPEYIFHSRFGYRSKERLLCKLHIAISRNILIIEVDQLELQGEVGIWLIL